MTALINVEGALPRPLWALVRYLLSSGSKRQPTERLRSLLSPPSLFGTDREDKEKTFDRTVKVAKELGLLSEDGDYVSLTDTARQISADDVDGFFDLLRHAVLHRVPATVLATDASNTEGKDLLRALSFFSSLPIDTHVDSNTYSRAQMGAISDELRNPFQNATRWNFFPSWAESLGFASTPLLFDGRTRTLVPDCRTAVRRTVLRIWPVDAELNPRELIDRLVTELPVLPGGEYSRCLGFDADADVLSQSLSAALLSGQDEGWLTLSWQSDAADAVQLWDPDEGAGQRRVSRVVIRKAA